MVQKRAFCARFVHFYALKMRKKRVKMVKKRVKNALNAH